MGKLFKHHIDQFCQLALLLLTSGGLKNTQYEGRMSLGLVRLRES
jgi:hypothetical protein